MVQDRTCCRNEFSDWKKDVWWLKKGFYSFCLSFLCICKLSVQHVPAKVEFLCMLIRWGCVQGVFRLSHTHTHICDRKFYQQFYEACWHVDGRGKGARWQVREGWHHTELRTGAITWFFNNTAPYWAFQTYPEDTLGLSLLQTDFVLDVSTCRVWKQPLMWREMWYEQVVFMQIPPGDNPISRLFEAHWGFNLFKLAFIHKTFTFPSRVYQ